MSFLSNIGSDKMFWVAIVVLAITAILAIVCAVMRCESIMSCITCFLVLGAIATLFVCRQDSVFPVVNAESYNSDFAQYKSDVMNLGDVTVTKDSPSIVLTNKNDVYFAQSSIEDESGNIIYTQEGLTAPGETCELNVFDLLEEGNHAIKILTYFYESDTLESAKVSQEISTITIVVQ